MPKPAIISVIVPCYNQARFLPYTLDSLVAQSYPHWECIIVDDGSPDNTGTVAQDYCNRDNRFIYLQKSNGGQGSARNLGLNHASGDYIQFLDSDDLLEPSRMQEVIRVFESSHVQVVQTDFSFCDHQDHQKIINLPGKQRVRLRRRPYRDLLSGWDRCLSIPIHTLTYKRALIETGQKRFNTNLPAQEDFDFHLSVFAQDPPVAYIPKALCRYRIGHSSTTGNVEKMAIGTFRVLNSQYKSRGIGIKWIILCNAGFRMVQLWATSIKCHQNIFQQSMACYRKEWQANPSTIYLGLVFIPWGIIDKLRISLMTRLKHFFNL